MFNIFNDFCQTNYLNICQTDLRQICRVGIIMAVDKRPGIRFSIPQETLLWQLNLLVLAASIHRLEWLGSRVVSVLDSGA